ncbi:hypothetical protein Tco_0195069 [Tanacetum coccineum]
MHTTLGQRLSFVLSSSSLDISPPWEYPGVTLGTLLKIRGISLPCLRDEQCGIASFLREFLMKNEFFGFNLMWRKASCSEQNRLFHGVWRHMEVETGLSSSLMIVVLKDGFLGPCLVLLVDGASWSTVVKEGEPVDAAGSGATLQASEAMIQGLDDSTLNGGLRGLARRLNVIIAGVILKLQGPELRIFGIAIAFSLIQNLLQELSQLIR